MKTIANKTTLNTRNNATVHVIDADKYYPEVLVSDEDGGEFFVTDSDLHQHEVAKTKEDAEYAWLQEEREIVWLREE